MNGKTTNIKYYQISMLISFSLNTSLTTSMFIFIEPAVVVDKRAIVVAGEERENGSEREQEASESNNDYDSLSLVFINSL